jgi:hypothetical protein
MDEIATQLTVESNKRGWHLLLNETAGILGARPDGYLLQAVCPNQEIAEEVKQFLFAHQLVHLVQVVPSDGAS